MGRGASTTAERRRRRFWRADEGATAVEFALVAGPFFLLLIGIFELGLIFMLSLTLENAIAKNGRRIRTGELQAVSSGQEAATLEAFRTKVCDDMAWMKADCLQHLSLDVRTVTTFAAVNLDPPINDHQLDKTNFGFKPGTGGPSPSIVLVRAWYEWPLIAPLMNQALVKLPGQTLITSAVVFSNEPY